MLRKSSVHALPIHTNALTGAVRRMPISEPTVSATTSEHADTRSVHPHADIIQAKYVWPLPVSCRNTFQSQLIPESLPCSWEIAHKKARRCQCCSVAPFRV